VTNPSVDIVMVAYRSEADLPSVFEGLKTFNSFPHELHFHDNIGNTKTLTMAWNELASRGKADYIVFLNTDIRLSPEWDARLIAGIERHADAGAVMPRPVGHDWPKLIDPSKSAYPESNTAPAPPPEAMRHLAEAWKDQENDYSFGGDCNAAFYAVMVRRSIFEALKGFDERLRFYGQDHDFQRRVMNRFGKYTIIIANAPVWHRCGGSVQKAAERGEVNFSAEMQHCGLITEALKNGSMLEWDILSDAERQKIHATPKYNRMPTH
jgi:hypothetical protein